MLKREVTISLINGLNLESVRAEIFGPLADEYLFVETATPRLCISGPYGNTPPPSGAFHVGYLCENIRPDPEKYDWVFGTLSESSVRHERYTCITWHGFDPRTLIKQPAQVDAWLGQHRRFCNFFYSNPVVHRENFCRALMSYQPVDCPGQSLRNMPPIDDNPHTARKWTGKRAFLSHYKFTVAFENSSAPGYHTEKILDPMTAGSIPIYWGDPEIGDVFNTASFIHVAGLQAPPSRALDRWLRRLGNRSLRDYQPGLYSRPADRMCRKLHHLSCKAADWLLRRSGWRAVIERVKFLDRNPDSYAAMLAEPWFTGNRPPARDPMRERWRLLLDRCSSQPDKP